MEAELDQAAATGLIDQAVLQDLPERFRPWKRRCHCSCFFEKKAGTNYAPAFASLLGVIDEVAKGLVIQKLNGAMPTTTPEQKSWFEPYLGKTDAKTHRHYQEIARNLQKTLVYRTSIPPLGLLRNCFDFALNDKNALSGVFDTISDEFRYTRGARSTCRHTGCQRLPQYAHRSSGEAAQRCHRSEEGAERMDQHPDLAMERAI